MHITCPLDNECREFQKVSAIVREGTREVTATVPVRRYYEEDGQSKSYTTYTSERSTIISDLAQALAEPAKPPEPPSMSCSAYMQAYLLAAPAVFLILGGGFSSLAIIISLFSGSGTPSQPFGAPLVLSVAAVVGGLLLARLAAVVRDHASKPLEVEREKYKSLLFEWEAAKGQWDRLYYCFRHDIVFDPGTSKFTTPENISTLVHFRAA